MENLFYNWYGVNQLLLKQIIKLYDLPYSLELSYFLDNIFHFLSFPVYFSLIILGFLIYWRNSLIKNKNGSASKFQAQFDLLAEIVLNYTIFVIVFTSLKHSVNLPRPICEQPGLLDQLPIDINKVRCLSSFPSAHSGLAVLIFMHLVKNKAPPVINFSMLILTITTCLSRVMLLMHYPADVVFGCLISAVVFILSNKLYKLTTHTLFRPIASKLQALLTKI
jgi:membrane-associated phospholipid phosphatase